MPEIAERLRVPKRYLGLARSVAHFHGMSHRARELRPVKLLELLTEIGIADRRGIAVAVNGVVVPRSEWKQRPLATDDEIEIVGAVQGG